MSGHIQHYQGTFRKCLLSSRSRVRVAVGAQVRGGVAPRRVSLGAKLGDDVRRRGFGEDGIYLDAARNRYMGAISLGCSLTAGSREQLLERP